MPRTHSGNTIEATPPDQCETVQFDGRTVEVHGWFDLISPTYKPGEAPATFTIWVFFDPLYDTPLVLGTNLTQAHPLTIFCLYQDRWPVEQIPLVAKQMLGLHRQFVFAPESCCRLPELALLLANILTYLAAVLPPLPTGFWDSRPQKLRGVCDGSYLLQNFLKLPCLTPNFAKRHRLQLIYRKVWRLIAAKRHQLDGSYQFCPVLQPIF